MKSEKEVFDDLCQFISSFVGVPLDKLSRATIVNKELGIVGDDAADFLAEFSKKYSVNLDFFPFHEYFSQEFLIWEIIFFCKYWKKGGKKELTINRLIQVIMEQSW